jgi:hypothetical protein
MKKLTTMVILTATLTLLCSCGKREELPDRYKTISEQFTLSDIASYKEGTYKVSVIDTPPHASGPKSADIDMTIKKSKDGSELVASGTYKSEDDSFDFTNIISLKPSQDGKYEYSYSNTLGSTDKGSIGVINGNELISLSSNGAYSLDSIMKIDEMTFMETGKYYNKSGKYLGQAELTYIQIKE